MRCGRTGERVVVGAGTELLSDQPSGGRLSVAFEDAGGRLRDRVQGRADVPLDADLERVRLVHLGDRPMDVHDRLVPAGVPTIRGVLDQVVAHRHHDVGVVETEVRVVADHEPDRPERVGVVVREDPFAEERRRHRQVQPFRESHERVHRAVSGDPGPGQDDGGRRSLEHLHRSLDLCVRRRGVDRDVHAERRARGLELGHVLRQDQERGARPLRPCLLERLADHLGHGLVHRDHPAPLRDGPEELDEIHGLVGFLVQAVQAGLRRDRDQRMRVEVRVRDPEHQVDRARPEGGEAYARTAGEGSVSVGHERGAALVPRGDEPDRGGSERIDHVEVLLPRQAEDVAHPFVLEAFHEEACHGSLPLRVVHTRQATLRSRSVRSTGGIP